MAINLENIKEKDIVHFRCGGMATIKFQSVDDGLADIMIMFEEYPYWDCTFTLDGDFGHYASPFDIVKIEEYVPTILTWYKVDDSGEFIRQEAEDYPKGASFRFINGLFTILDENGEKKSMGCYK